MKYVCADETFWPATHRPADAEDGVEWRLRYGPNEPSHADRFDAAAIIEAYRALVMLPQRRRNVVAAALKAAARAAQREKGPTP